MGNAEAIRNQLKLFLESHPDIECAYVFGSVLDDRFSSTSDIDLGVAANAPLTGEQRQALKTTLEAALNRDVDLIDLTTATGTILKQALRGACLICRKPAVKAQLITRLIYDQEDMQPLRDRMMRLRRERFAYGH